MTLKEYKENSFLNIYNTNSNYINGYLITNDGQVIKYHQDETTLITKLPSADLTAFKTYLIEEEKILDTEFPQPQTFNPSKIIKININGQKKDIINSSKEFTHNSQEEIYDRIYQEIKDIVSLWGNNQ